MLQSPACVFPDGGQGSSFIKFEDELSRVEESMEYVEGYHHHKSKRWAMRFFFVLPQLR